MNRTKIVTKALLCGAAVAVALVSVLGSSSAQARGGGRGMSWEEIEYKAGKGERGYSGFAPGSASIFCDYIRMPDRKCTVGRDGRERCSVVGYTIKQHCYK